MTRSRIIDVKKYLKRPPPSLLWHYTTLEGLQGIVKEAAIWATDVRYLNDSREYVHAVDLFREVIAEGKKRASHVEGVVLDHALDLIENVQTLENYRVFVSSFSASEDQLSQWRAYGSNVKGVSMGFDLRGLAISEREISSNTFSPCVYSRQRQINMVRAWLEDFSTVLRRVWDVRSKKDLVSVDKDEPIDVISEKVLTALGSELSMDLIQIMLDAGRLCALLKHESFAEEKEWRLVVAESRKRISPSPHERKVRVGLTTFIPYISFPLGISKAKVNANCRIKAVKIGPHSDSQRAIDAAIEFLSAKGLADVKVDASRIPFRNW